MQLTCASRGDLYASGTSPEESPVCCARLLVSVITRWIEHGVESTSASAEWQRQCFRNHLTETAGGSRFISAACRKIAEELLFKAMIVVTW